MSLYKRRRDKDKDGLDEEGPCEREPAVRVYASRLCEEVAADEEEDDSGQRFEPDVRLRNGLV